MYVFRHEHVSTPLAANTTSHSDGVGEPLTAALGFQERIAMKTGESELMSMAWIIGCRPSHAPIFPVHDRSAEI
jgi:hypothetical protein